MLNHTNKPFTRMTALIRHLSLLLVPALLLGGCATVPKQPENYRAGAAVESLKATVSISVKSDEMSTGGNGYLLYRRPDQFHLVFLSPFGTTVMEFFAGSDRLTFLLPSKSVAYSGSFADLPDQGGLRGWRLMKWAVDGAPLFNEGKPGTVELINSEGRRETATYDPAGLLQQKKTEDGDQVSYREYQCIDGVPFPGVIEFTDRQGARVKIRFDDPEINGQVEDAALTPSLDGITILPLASFRGN